MQVIPVGGKDLLEWEVGGFDMHLHAGNDENIG
jgi:hypothetical protein